MSTNEMPDQPASEEQPEQEAPEVEMRMADAEREVELARAEEDAALDEEDEALADEMEAGQPDRVAKAAREERMRLMAEYLEHFFLEDLPPIDPADPFNQGIYMRYRINQMRSAQGKGPVL